MRPGASKTKRKNASFNLGPLSPNPWDLSLSRQNGWLHGRRLSLGILVEQGGHLLMRVPRHGLFAFLVFSALAQQSTSPVPDKRSPFLQVPAVASDTLRFLTQLGNFEATDLSGRRWSSGDLRAKVTFVDIWATSCGPCRREHPEIQRFYEKIKIASN